MKRKNLYLSLLFLILFLSHDVYSYDTDQTETNESRGLSRMIKPRGLREQKKIKTERVEDHMKLPVYAEMMQWNHIAGFQKVSNDDEFSSHHHQSWLSNDVESMENAVQNSKCIGNYIPYDGSLYIGYYLCSKNGIYKFGFKVDASDNEIAIRLSLYERDKEILTSETSTTISKLTDKAAGIKIGFDGSLLVSNEEGLSIWKSNVNEKVKKIKQLYRTNYERKLGSKTSETMVLALDDTGRVSISSTSADDLDSTTTFALTPYLCYSQLRSSGILREDEYICTQDEVWLFGVDVTGDLALFNKGTKVWTAGTGNGMTGNYVIMEANGNLSVRNILGNILWESDTRNNPGSSLLLQPFYGNVSIISPTGKKVKEIVEGGAFPSVVPTISFPPTNDPSKAPIPIPSRYPTRVPVPAPSNEPSEEASENPTAGTSPIPTKNQSYYPSKSPSSDPTSYPSKLPIIISSNLPTLVPSIPSSRTPSFSPSLLPTTSPTYYHSQEPSTNPSLLPTISPTYYHSQEPSISPSINPTEMPTSNPSEIPTVTHTSYPTSSPSSFPSILSTNEPVCFQQLNMNEALLPGEFVCSPNDEVRFGLTLDGDLAMLINNSKIWSSSSNDFHPNTSYVYALLDDDASFVVYDVNKELWTSNIAVDYNTDATLEVNNEGKAFITDNKNDELIWYIKPTECTFQLKSKYRLYSGGYLCSSNGRYKFGLNDNYELTVFDTTLQSNVWNAGEFPDAGEGTHLEMEFSGNLVLKTNTGQILWNIETSSQGAFAVIRSDGRVQIRDKDNKTIKTIIFPGQFLSQTPSAVVSSSPTVSSQPTNTRTCYNEMATESFLLPGEFVCSPDGTIRFGLDYQADLSMFSNNEKVWSAGTDEHANVTFVYAELQDDGNFVVHDLKESLWASNSDIDDDTITVDVELTVSDAGKVYITDVGTGYIRWTLVPYCLSALFTDARLYVDQYICSINKQWKFGLDESYHLVMINTATNWITWRADFSNNDNGPGTFLVMQEDGNLVVYNQQDEVLWDSDTHDYDHSYRSALIIFDSGLVAVTSHHGEKIASIVDESIVPI